MCALSVALGKHGSEMVLATDGPSTHTGVDEQLAGTLEHAKTVDRLFLLDTQSILGNDDEQSLQSAESTSGQSRMYS